MATQATPEDAGTKLLDEFPVDPDTVNESDSVPEPEPATSPVPDAPKPPSWLLRAARQVGLDDAEIAGMDPAELRSAVDTLARTRETTRQEQANDQTARARDPETGRFLPVSPAEPAADKPFDIKDFGVDPSKWTDGDAETIATDILKAVSGKFEQLRRDFDELKGREAAREQNAQFDRLDRLFAEDAATYGKGTRHGLKPGTPEAIRRQSVIAAMGQIKKANPGLTLEDTFAEASQALFGLKRQEPADADPKGFLNGHLARPTVRETKPPPKGTRLATANLANRLSTMKAVEPDTEFDDLPP